MTDGVKSDDGGGLALWRANIRENIQLMASPVAAFGIQQDF